MLNTRPFLEERRATIEAQTWQDFEVVVIDDGSTDGSWEFFEEWASADDRVSLYLGPQKGLYPGWNDAIRRSRGHYVHIATSDDTMAPNFLEEMVGALDVNPDCSLAHCPLKIFSDSRPDAVHHWWNKESPFALSVDGRVGVPHRRLAPGDGLLHACGVSVYVSTTQLLTRREVFDEIGDFSDKWGAIGDFEWSIRVGLQRNTVHVPTTWGGWRIHDGQATSKAGFDPSPRVSKNLEVFASVINSHRDLQYLTDAFDLVSKEWDFVRHRARFRELSKNGFNKEFLEFVLVHPRISALAVAGKLGISKRWRWRNEQIVIERLRKSLNWILINP